MPPPRPDPVALMQGAVEALVGRDLVTGRALLRRAVAAGHVDAALMEVALTANGSGGAADWPAALALLRTAAGADGVAAAQFALVDAMHLTAGGAPAAVPLGRSLCDNPRVVLFPRFLTAAECAHIASVAAAVMEQSLVIDAGGRRVAHPVRRCDNGVIGPTREDLVVRAINHRIAAASGTATAQGEPLTILRYGRGHEYRPHLDTLPGAANQRAKTMLLYLNDGFAGGETEFPAARLTITPRAGDALLFDTLDAGGVADPRALHAGRPVTAGVKWIASRWIRCRPIDPWTM